MNKTRHIHIRISDRLEKKIKLYCYVTGMSKTKMIEKALEKMIREKTNEKTS